MNLIVHGQLSWLTTIRIKERRDRWLVVAAGLAPDLDGLSLLGGTAAYAEYHHLLFHGYVGALITTALCMAFARQRVAVGLLACLSFHLHLVCDLMGSGVDWPIYYFWPTSMTTIGWSGGWELVSWQNTVIGLMATLACLGMAIPWGRTFVELFTTKGDQLVVETLRARFGRKPPKHSSKPAP